MSEPVVVNARVGVTLRLPRDVIAPALTGTVFEDTLLGHEGEHDREAIGQLLDDWVAENLPYLMDFAHTDADVECDW